jgi:riboflavin biosynthesis pyrimidine reductase
MDFAGIWQAADKIVYSKTLAAVSTPRTRLERTFDAEAVRAWKARAVRDISVGGPTLAAEAMRQGLVDEIQLLVAPALLGAGTRVLPADMRIGLELLDERHFGNGMVYLRYRATG